MVLFGKEQETHEHVTALTNPIIRAKFTEAIDSVTKQGKAMIGLGSNKKLHMRQLQMLQKVEYGGGPFFKVVLEC